MASSPCTNALTSPALLFYDAIINNDIDKLRRMVEIYKFDLNAKFPEVGFFYLHVFDILLTINFN